MGRRAGRSTRRSTPPGSTSRRPAAPPILRADGEGVGVNATLPVARAGAPSAEAARQSVESGFPTLKLKAGAERETEVLVERVRAIRLAVGPDVRLRLDVNGAWDLATAEDRLEAVARFDIEFVEQPLPAHDLDGLADAASPGDGPDRGRRGGLVRPPRCATCSRPRPWTSSSSSRRGSVARPPPRRSPSAPPSGACRSSSARCSRPGRDRRRARRGRRVCPTSPGRAGRTSSITGWRRPACSSTTC